MFGNSTLTSTTESALVVVNLPTRAPLSPVKPTPPFAVEPGYLYEYPDDVMFIVWLPVLFAFTSSAGTDTVMVSLPIFDGVKLANVTTAWPPHEPSDEIIFVSENVSTPVTFKVTDRFVAGVRPLLVISALTWLAARPNGTSPYE